MKEENRTPEEIKAKKEALEKRKSAHKGFKRARRALQVTTLVSASLLTKSTEAEAQGFHYERVNTTEAQAPQEAVYGTLEWAMNQGYTPSEFYSQGLNHFGIRGPDGNITHRGYKVACIKYNYQSPDASEILFIPNFPEDAKPEDCQYISVVKGWKNQPDNTRDFSNPYKRSNIGGYHRTAPRPHGTYRHGGWRYEETPVEKAGRAVREVDRTIRDVKYTYDVITGKMHNH